VKGLPTQPVILSFQSCLHRRGMIAVFFMLGSTA